MSLLVNHIVSSSVSIDYSYLDSDEIFGYVVTANYKLSVADIQFDDQNGVLLNGRAAIRAAYSQKNITARIGGDEFTNGVITNISFPEGSLSGSEEVSITIIERKALNDYSSKTFAKYLPSPQLIESFDETYSFNRSGSEYSYTRNISIKYSQDCGDQFLNNAKTFLTNYYYQNRPSLGYYEDGISENARFDDNFDGLLTETIDLIDLSVSLQESFTSYVVDSSNDFSKNITQKLSQNERGYLSKEYTIDISSNRYDSQKIIDEACSSVIDDIIADEYAQFGNPHSIEKGITKDSKRMNLRILFSTDPSLSQDNTIFYSCSKEKNGSYINYILSVTYKSIGKNLSKRYDNTINLWKANKNNNVSKVQALFSGASTIYESSRSTNISRSNCTVSENITFSTNDAYDSDSLPSGIIKYDITVQKQNETKRIEKLVDIRSLKEKIVQSDLNSIRSATVTATAIAPLSYGKYRAKQFLQTKTTEMNNSLGETNFYGVSDETTVDLSNGTATRVINYILT